MRCPNCGATNRSSAHFCNQCGASLEPQVAPSVMPAPAPPREAPSPPPAAFMPLAPAPPAPLPDAALRPPSDGPAPLTAAPEAVEQGATSAPPPVQSSPAEGQPVSAPSQPMSDLPLSSPPQAVGSPAPSTPPGGGGVSQPAAPSTPSAPPPAAALASASVDPAAAPAPEPAAPPAAPPPPPEPLDSAPLDAVASTQASEVQGSPAPAFDAAEPPMSSASAGGLDDGTDAALTGPAAPTAPPPADGPAAPLPPVRPALQSVVGGRYAVVGLPAEGSGESAFTVRDLTTCPVCHTTLDNPDDAYCTNCGAALKDITLQMEEVTDLTALPDDPLEHQGRYYRIVQPAAAPPATAMPKLMLAAALRTDSGQARELNEDSVFGLTADLLCEGTPQPAVGLYIVADGMGGHEGGEVASRLAIRSIATDLLQRVVQPLVAGETVAADTLPQALVGAVQQANDVIVERSRQAGSDMGTTVTLALVVDGVAYVANLGDSRTYLWSGGLLTHITDDHSVVWNLYKTGSITEEEIYTHQSRNLVFRSLGARGQAEVDTFTQPLAPDDRLILCSDGLWEMIHDEGVELVMRTERHPQAACDKLVEQANLKGGEDNISVIVVQALGV